jgi:hypothetical protein
MNSTVNNNKLRTTLVVLRNFMVFFLSSLDLIKIDVLF